LTSHTFGVRLPDRLLVRLTERARGFPDLDFYELRHCAATMLLERGVTPWDVAHQLGHQDGGRLVMSLYGHPSEAGARSRLLAAWETAPLHSGAVPISSGANRAQVS